MPSMKRAAPLARRGSLHAGGVQGAASGGTGGDRTIATHNANPIAAVIQITFP
jgi:hypothetical protein